MLLCSRGCRFLTGSIEEVSKGSGINQSFLGLIVLPIAGNACEHITAVFVAAKDKMDLAIGVALGSSIQVSFTRRRRQGRRALAATGGTLHTAQCQTVSWRRTRGRTSKAGTQARLCARQPLKPYPRPHARPADRHLRAAVRGAGGLGDRARLLAGAGPPVRGHPHDVRCAAALLRPARGVPASRCCTASAARSQLLLQRSHCCCEKCITSC